MSDMIYVEPAHEARPAFAMWGLAQTPPLQTASATGWNVPLSLYPDVPSELLAGAFVDGFRYDHTMPQPEAVQAPVPSVDPFTPEPASAPRKPRNRSRSKGATP